MRTALGVALALGAGALFGEHGVVYYKAGSNIVRILSESINFVKKKNILHIVKDPFFSVFMEMTIINDTFLSQVRVLL